MLRRNFLASAAALAFARPGFAAASEGTFEVNGERC